MRLKNQERHMIDAKSGDGLYELRATWPYWSEYFGEYLHAVTIVGQSSDGACYVNSESGSDA